MAMAAWTLPNRIADWCEILTTALDRRSRKYFLTIILGMLLGSGRRTVSCWLRAAGVTDDWQDHYYFLQTLGRSAKRVATELLHLAVKQIPVCQIGEFIKLALDDPPTKRYGPRVELAGTHHNPTPGPSGSEFLYGHVWVTISWLVTHPQWGCIGMTTRLVLYGKEQNVSFKTFLATYAPVGGVIRVVIVKRSPELFSDCPAEWLAFFCTDAEVSAETIIERVADRSAVEQNFHDVKEVHGAGEQQVRNVWCNVACWNLCLWLHTIVELWSWKRSGNTLKQRDDRPWDDPSRRPSHADRLKTLKKHTLRETFSSLPRHQRAARKIRKLFQALTNLLN